MQVPGLSDYNLRAPTEYDAVAALERVFGPMQAKARWLEACSEVLRTPGTVQPGADLARVAEALGAQGGPAASVARSIEIRMRTYDRLLQRTIPPDNESNR